MRGIPQLVSSLSYTYPQYNNTIILNSMIQSLSDLENRFITHIRTLQMKSSFVYKKREDEFVFLSMREIRSKYFIKPEENISKLIELKLIESNEFTTKKGHKATEYRVLVDGDLDFSLLTSHSKPLDKTTSMIKNNLRWVGIKDDDNSNIYFTNFLNSLDDSLDPFFLVDNFSGRIHSPITSLKGERRKYLLIKGNRTISLDIGQMQPLLLSKILKENIGENEFSTWIDNGLDIYVLIQEKLNIPSREEAKPRFYEITFGQSNDQLAQLFGNSNWIEWINKVKSTPFYHNPNTLRKLNSNLAWLLQSTEVEIMTKIWKQLIDNDIIFLTVHDEIIVRESDYEETYNIILDTMSYHFSTFKINTKSILCEEQLKLTLQEKFAQLPTDIHFYPTELFDKFNIWDTEIKEALALGIIEESFEGAYQLKINS
jgi:hypothetical protein